MRNLCEVAFVSPSEQRIICKKRAGLCGSCDSRSTLVGITRVIHGLAGLDQAGLREIQVPELLERERVLDYAWGRGICMIFQAKEWVI